MHVHVYRYIFLAVQPLFGTNFIPYFSEAICTPFATSIITDYFKEVSYTE
jgi:hypothetical protein